MNLLQIYLYLRSADGVSAIAAGRDVASGSYRMVAVQMAFSKAARRLEKLAQSRSSKKINYLQGLFDVKRALDRSAVGKSSKQAWGVAGGGATDEYFVIGQSNRYVVSKSIHPAHPLFNVGV